MGAHGKLSTSALAASVVADGRRRGDWFSDAFTRADAVGLGETDGNGDTAYPNGRKTPWIAVMGEFSIVSNAAKASTMSGGVAAVGIDTGWTDVVVRAKVTRSSGTVGVIARKFDLATVTYLRAWHDGTNVRVTKIIGGVATTIIADTPTAHVAGAELVMSVVGTQVTVYYNGILIGTVTVADAALQTGTLCGLYSSSVSNVMDDFVAQKVEATYTAPLMRLYRVDNNTFNLRIPVTGAARDIVASYELNKFTSTPAGWGFAPSTWNLGDLLVKDLSGAVADVTLALAGSVWEYSYKVGIADAAAGDFDFYGAGHGAELSTSAYVVIDGVTIPLASIANGRTLIGKSISFIQASNTYLPFDKTTVCGSSTRNLTASSTGLTLSHNHNYLSGYQIYSAYSAMLPTTNTDGAGIDTYKVGANPEAARLFDGSINNLNTQTDTVYARHSAAQPYKVTMTMPDGGPDVNGDWSLSGNYKAWFHDLAPDPTGLGKFYVNYVDTQYAGRIAAVASKHRTHYHVEIA